MDWGVKKDGSNIKTLMSDVEKTRVRHFRVVLSSVAIVRKATRKKRFFDNLEQYPSYLHVQS